VGDELDHELHEVSVIDSHFPIVELRHYTMQPGRRDELIELFEREFIDTQEAAGMRVIGHFRDLDDPDAFTWLRGFASMDARAESLTAFYDGPVWRANRDAANATMIDSDDVRLLRPTRGIALEISASALIVATIWTLSPAAASNFGAVFEGTIAPHLVATGGAPIGVFETEQSANTFPRLPVREGEHAVVWLASFADVAEHARHVSLREAGATWRDEVQPLLARSCVAQTLTWRLTPCQHLAPSSVAAVPARDSRLQSRVLPTAPPQRGHAQQLPRSRPRSS
jgi:hypothetical protein